MRRFGILSLVLAGFLVFAVSADAQNRPVQFHGLGPRVGLSIDPDQFVFGGHIDFGDPFPQTNLLFPVVEIGVGDGNTITSIGTDLLFRFTNNWGAWTPYVGGELAFLIVTRDTPGGGEDTDTNLGLSGVFGVEKGIGADNRFAVELKFQLVDAPDIKIAALWTFGH